MKANEFVKENGIEKCKRILDDLTDQGHNGDFYKELKRLVESHELIASRGGLCAAKHELITLQKHLNNTFGWATITTSEKIDRLKQAIADVESCQ